MLMPMLWNNNSALDMRTPFDDMDDWFNSFWGNGLEAAQAMKTDVIEEAHDYKMQADLPGFNKEDIKIDMRNGILTIHASHDENKDEKDASGRYIRHERHTASYERSFRVPHDLEPQDVDARYKNGVLTVTLPKKEGIPQQEEPRQITVN